MSEPMSGISKLVTGIPGLDHISMGGLPAGRSTLCAGTSGSAKTVLAVQFLIEGIRLGQPGVFVTFEESTDSIRQNMAAFGWDIAAFEEAGQWRFVDATPLPEATMIESGDYDLGGLLLRVGHAVEEIRAERVSIDSVAALLAQYDQLSAVRQGLVQIGSVVRALGATLLITAEREDEYGAVGRLGIEEFVADNVIILRNALEGEKRRRTIELLKLRGTNHRKGEFPFTITENGIQVLPLSEIELTQPSTMIRISSGNQVLDRMTDGGFFRDSIILVSGATGCGKTMLCSEFLSPAFHSEKERGLLFAFEESRDQLLRNVEGRDADFRSLEREGRLKIVANYPEAAGLEDQLVMIKREVEEFRPTRVAIDSLSALERVSTIKGYREFVIGITSFLKEKQISGLFTSTTQSLMGGESITEQHISTITDIIILLRYVEMFGEMKRGITVLKMRGSMHEKEIREFVIDVKGIHIGEAYNNVTGILTGEPRYLPSGEADRLRGLFRTGAT